MKDLEELPLFKGLIEKGLKEGREQAREQARKEQLELLRDFLVEVVETRMPELRALAQQQAALIEKPETLHALRLNLRKAATPEEARRYLLTWQKPTRKKKA